MPSWKVHIAMNLVLFFIWLKLVFFFSQADWFYPIFMLPLLLLTSIFPDIDTSKSKIRNWTSITVAVGVLVVLIPKYSELGLFKLSALPLVAFLVFKYFPTKHRGITHTLLAAMFFSAAFSALSFFVYPEMIVATFAMLFTAYTSHLLLDVITRI